jgi:hypothetical protein
MIGGGEANLPLDDSNELIAEPDFVASIDDHVDRQLQV